MSEHKTYDPVIDESLEDLTLEFEGDAASPFVPTNLVLSKFGTLCEALDWNCTKKVITPDEVKSRFVKHSAQMLAKFDIPYQRLPR